MRKCCRLLFLVTVLFSIMASAAHADEGPIYNVLHIDIVPVTIGGIDFLQNGYSLMFKYRDQSKTDPGLQSFRVLNVYSAVENNHAEIVEVWNNYEAYKSHLAKSHTVGFRFDVQGNPALGGSCCVGSPIDDRQYRFVQSFKAPWSSAAIPSTVGPSGALFVVTYVELLQDGNVAQGQDELLDYGAATSRLNGAHILSYSVLQQLDRPNRYAVLEIWDSQTSYNTWQTLGTTTSFIAKILPLLGSPFDHRVTILCGNTYVDGTGCTPP